MSTLAEIESAIRNLPAAEFAELREWIVGFDPADVDPLDRRHIFVDAATWTEFCRMLDEPPAREGLARLFASPAS